MMETAEVRESDDVATLRELHRAKEKGDRFIFMTHFCYPSLPCPAPPESFCQTSRIMSCKVSGSGFERPFSEANEPAGTGLSRTSPGKSVVGWSDAAGAAR